MKLGVLGAQEREQMPDDRHMPATEVARWAVSHRVALRRVMKHGVCATIRLKGTIRAADEFTPTQAKIGLAWGTDRYIGRCKMCNLDFDL